jgi:hypothetical protein
MNRVLPSRSLLKANLRFRILGSVSEQKFCAFSEAIDGRPMSKSKLMMQKIPVASHNVDVI